MYMYMGPVSGSGHSPEIIKSPARSTEPDTLARHRARPPLVTVELRLKWAYEILWEGLLLFFESELENRNFWFTFVDNYYRNMCL